MVYSKPFFCIIRVDFSKKMCLILPSNLRLPIYVMWENFHLSCRGSYRAQEGRFFYFLAVRGGGVVSPRKFLKKLCKWSILSLFCRLIVNIFSKTVWKFCDDPADTRNARVCSPLIKRELSPLVWGRGSHPVFFFVSENRMQMVHLNPFLVDWVFGILLKCHIFVMKALMWRVCDAGVFPSYASGVFVPV